MRFMLAVALVLGAACAPADDGWNDGLWRQVIFDLEPGADAGDAQVWILPEPHGAILAARGFEPHDTEIRAAMEAMVQGVYGRAWAGDVEYADHQPAQPTPTTRGVIILRFRSLDGAAGPETCADANIANDLGLIEFDPECWVLDSPPAFRAMIAHEVGHSFGLFHNRTGEAGIMSPEIYSGNLPTFDSLAFQAEMDVARCAVAVGRGARYEGRRRPAACPVGD